MSSCKISSKLVKRLQRYRRSLNISPVWYENGYLRFFSYFGVKNRRKLKLSALSSVYECTDLGLKLHWHRGSKLYQNQWNNSWYIAFDNFFKKQHPLSWSFFKFYFWTTVMIWIANMCYHAKFHLDFFFKFDF